MSWNFAIEDPRWASCINSPRVSEDWLALRKRRRFKIPCRLGITRGLANHISRLIGVGGLGQQLPGLGPQLGHAQTNFFHRRTRPPWFDPLDLDCGPKAPHFFNRICFARRLPNGGQGARVVVQLTAQIFKRRPQLTHGKWQARPPHGSNPPRSEVRPAHRTRCPTTTSLPQTRRRPFQLPSSRLQRGNLDHPADVEPHPIDIQSNLFDGLIESQDGPIQAGQRAVVGLHLLRNPRYAARWHWLRPRPSGRHPPLRCFWNDLGRISSTAALCLGPTT